MNDEYIIEEYMIEEVGISRSGLKQLPGAAPSLLNHVLNVLFNHVL